MAVSYDSVEVLGRFAAEQDITYPLLSDQGSEVIRRFGILNTLIAPDEENYGIPYPGVYLVGEDGRVLDKQFHREYRVRDSGAALVRGILGVVNDDSQFPAARGEVGVSVSLATPDLKPWQRTELRVRIEIEPGTHLYGRPAPDGMVPVTVTVHGPDALRVEGPRYPATRPLSVAGVAQPLHVFEGNVEVVVPVVFARGDARRGDLVPLDVEVRYQACTERECFLPVTERLHLDLLAGALNRRPRPATP